MDRRVRRDGGGQPARHEIAQTPKSGMKDRHRWRTQLVRRRIEMRHDTLKRNTNAALPRAPGRAAAGPAQGRPCREDRRRQGRNAIRDARPSQRWHATC